MKKNVDYILKFYFLYYTEHFVSESSDSFSVNILNNSAAGGGRGGGAAPAPAR
jgi:hypothetical protein